MDLWMDDHARITCTEHGGKYLAASDEANPGERIHHTPLGAFQKMTSELRRELAPSWFPTQCATCTEMSA